MDVPAITRCASHKGIFTRAKCLVGITSGRSTIIRNKPFGRALIFNMHDWRNPTRSERTLAAGTDVTCDAVP